MPTHVIIKCKAFGWKRFIFYFYQQTVLQYKVYFLSRESIAVVEKYDIQVIYYQKTVHTVKWRAQNHTHKKLKN